MRDSQREDRSVSRKPRTNCPLPVRATVESKGRQEILADSGSTDPCPPGTSHSCENQLLVPWLPFLNVPIRVFLFLIKFVNPVACCVQIRAVLVEKSLCTFQGHFNLAEELGASAGRGGEEKHGQTLVSS